MPPPVPLFQASPAAPNAAPGHLCVFESIDSPNTTTSLVHTNAFGSPIFGSVTNTAVAAYVQGTWAARPVAVAFPCPLGPERRTGYQRRRLRRPLDKAEEALSRTRVRLGSGTGRSRRPSRPGRVSGAPHGSRREFGRRVWGP